MLRWALAVAVLEFVVEAGDTAPSDLTWDVEPNEPVLETFNPFVATTPLPVKAPGLLVAAIMGLPPFAFANKS